MKKYFFIIFTSLFSTQKGVTMDKPSPKKIAIIGNAGSGKSTLAFELQKKLDLPLYHLDQYAWKPDWQKVDWEVFKKAHNALCQQDEWIIEGIYLKLLHERVTYADVIIFLDVPRSVCIWRVLKRAVTNYGQDIPGNPEKCKQRLFSFKFLEFLKWIWNFNNRHRQVVLDVLREFKDKKQIYILRSPEEITTFVQQFEK